MTNKNFDPKVVARASSAAEGLCKWIRAMVLYDGVAKVVAPKKAKLVASERELKETLEFLKERRQMLAELNEKLEVLREKLRETLARKIALEDEVSEILRSSGVSYLKSNAAIKFFILLLYGEKGKLNELA